jgi:hypothetical protein
MASGALSSGTFFGEQKRDKDGNLTLSFTKKSTNAETKSDKQICAELKILRAQQKAAREAMKAKRLSKDVPFKRTIQVPPCKLDTLRHQGSDPCQTMVGLKDTCAQILNDACEVCGLVPRRHKLVRVATVDPTLAFGQMSPCDGYLDVVPLSEDEEDIHHIHIHTHTHIHIHIHNHIHIHIHIYIYISISISISIYTYPYPYPYPYPYQYPYPQPYPYDTGSW